MSPTPPTPVADAHRREQIKSRIASLRTLGTSGAIAALGIFTGLSATHQRPAASPSVAASHVQATQSTSSPAQGDPTVAAPTNTPTTHVQSGIGGASGNNVATSSSTS